MDKQGNKHPNSMDIAPEPILVRRDIGRKKMKEQRNQEHGMQIKLIPP